MGQKDSLIPIQQGWHEKFGKISFLVALDPPQEVQIVAHLTYEQSSDQYVKWREMLEKLQNNPKINSYLILPVNIQAQRCLLCTNGEQKLGIKLFYSNFRNSLHEDIKNRKEVSNCYHEHQIWYLMYVLLKVAAHFEQQAAFLGNVHTDNVYFDEKGKFHIFTLYSSPQEIQNIERIKSSKYEDTYIAPEEIQALNSIFQSSQSEKLNQNKIDLFNIGLVLLSALLLKDCYFLYNHNSFSMNFDKLQACKEELQNTACTKYRKTLRGFIMHFLIIDPILRKTPSYYFNLIKRFEKPILDFQDFHPENHFTIEQSPEALNSLDGSPNTKETRYLSLSKNWESHSKQGKKQKQTDRTLQKQQLFQPQKIKRKLFQEDSNDRAPHFSQQKY